MTLLDDIYQLATTDQDAATYRLFDAVDRLLCDGDFAAVDEVLRLADVDRLNSFLLRSFLVITAPAREYLPSSPEFYQKAEARMVELSGEKVARKILRGLA